MKKSPFRRDERVDRFFSNLHNFRSVVGMLDWIKLEDEEAGDWATELDLMLYARSKLQDDFDDPTFAPRVERNRQYVEHLDLFVRKHRDIILAIIGRGLARRREMLGCPRSHWWWYLDEVSELPAKELTAAATTPTDGKREPDMKRTAEAKTRP